MTTCAHQKHQPPYSTEKIHSILCHSYRSSSIEARVEDSFATEVVLASEKAMSMKNSPYRSVASLTEFVLLEMASQPSVDAAAG